MILAEYFISLDVTLLFLVRSDFDAPLVVEIPHGVEEIRRFVLDKLGAELGVDGKLRRAGDKIRDLDEAGFQAFLAPFVAPLLEPTTQGDPLTAAGDLIWFVPHDVLHYLPLHAVRAAGGLAIYLPDLADPQRADKQISPQYANLAFSDTAWPELIGWLFDQLDLPTAFLAVRRQRRAAAEC